MMPVYVCKGFKILSLFKKNFFRFRSDSTLIISFSSNSSNCCRQNLQIEATDHEIRSPKYGLLTRSSYTRERDHQRSAKSKSENRKKKKKIRDLAKRDASGKVFVCPGRRVRGTRIISHVREAGVNIYYTVYIAPGPRLTATWLGTAGRWCRRRRWPLAWGDAGRRDGSQSLPINPRAFEGDDTCPTAKYRPSSRSSPPSARGFLGLYSC